MLTNLTKSKLILRVSNAVFNHTYKICENPIHVCPNGKASIIRTTHVAFSEQICDAEIKLNSWNLSKRPDQHQ